MGEQQCSAGRGLACKPCSCPCRKVCVLRTHRQRMYACSCASSPCLLVKAHHVSNAMEPGRLGTALCCSSRLTATAACTEAACGPQPRRLAPMLTADHSKLLHLQSRYIISLTGMCCMVVQAPEALASPASCQATATLPWYWTAAVAPWCTAESSAQHGVPQQHSEPQAGWQVPLLSSTTSCWQQL